MDNQLDKLQRDYFDFCTELIRKISPEKENQDSLMMKAFEFRDGLEREIIRNEIGNKNESLRKVEQEIEHLKTTLGINK